MSYALAEVSAPSLRPASRREKLRVEFLLNSIKRADLGIIFGTKRHGNGAFSADVTGGSFCISLIINRLDGLRRRETVKMRVGGWGLAGFGEKKRRKETKN